MLSRVSNEKEGLTAPTFAILLTSGRCGARGGASPVRYLACAIAPFGSSLSRKGCSVSASFLPIPQKSKFTPA